MNDERQTDEAIDAETATALPRREAMSMIAPPPVSGLLKLGPTDDLTTDQGIDESDPAGAA